MIKEIVKVVKIDNRYKLYNKDSGCYISGYDNKDIAMKHADKENIRISKYKIFFDINKEEWKREGGGRYFLSLYPAITNSLLQDISKEVR